MSYNLAVMPVHEHPGQDARSFIEAARRAQIVECAIEVIAEVGYRRASMARIAERAKISRGLISYHFAGKDELISQVVLTVFADAAGFMEPRVEAETTAAGQLRAYIQSNLEYMRTHPDRIIAIVEILSGGALADGTLGIDPIDAEEQALAPLVELFRRGQENGEFRAFDPWVMASAVRNVIDGVPPHVSDPNLDLDACAHELTTLFDLATRNPETAAVDAKAAMDTAGEHTG
jgi:AcrR family transcriptional regulator